MAEAFVLPVEYQGEARDFDCELRVMGYTYKIAVQVNNAEILFEPDEEGYFRATTQAPDERKSHWDKDLLAAIAEQLALVFSRH